MTNKLKKVGKKAFSMSVTVMTIAWSIGVAALVPAGVSAATCPTLAAGDLFKVADNTAVYLLNSDMERMYFPNGEVYKTWYADYSGINVIPNTCVDAYPAPTAAPYGVNYRPGSRLVKVQISPSVYVVEPGNTKSKIASAAIASELYGADWATKVRDVADVFWPNYANSGSEITESALHNGMLVKKTGETTVYQMVDGMLYMVDGAMSGATSGDVQEVSATVFDAAAMATTNVTPSSVVEDPTQGATTGGSGTVVTGGDLTVSLSADTPVSSYIAKGAYNAEFARFNFRASSGDAVVSKVTLKRDGFGADANLNTVRLFDGATQVGSDQTVNVNTHEITFKNLNWTIASGVTKTLSVKVTTPTSTSGTNDYVSLIAVESDGTVGGSALPIAGNTMQYHAVTVGVVDVDALSTPATTNLISGATDQQVACFNVDTNASEGFYMHSLTLSNNGTIANGELSNFVLREGNTIVGTNTGTYDSSGKVTIDMTGSPYFIDKSKTKDLCLSVDIASGIKDVLAKTIIVQIAESKDIVMYGDLSKAQVVPTIDDATTFTAQTSQTMTIAQGTLTVARNTATNPVAIALIDGVEHNKLAAYKFTAGSTEGARVTRLRLTASDTTITSADLSNFELYTYDEVTATETLVSGSASISGGYVTFEDTNGLFDIAQSKNVVVHVYADVNTAASYTNASVFIGGTNSDLIVKAKGLASGEFLNGAQDITLSGVAAADAILFTNSTNGTLTVSLNQDTPASDSVAKGLSDVDFAHAKLYAASEDLSITSVTVRALIGSAATTFSTPTTTDYLNARLYDITDAANPVMLGTAVATPAAGVATFSTNLVVTKDAYKVLKVVADVPTDSEGDYVRFVFASTTDDITVTGISSGVTLTSSSISGPAVGKIMTVAAPTVAVSWSVTPPAQSIVTSAQDVHVATLNLTAGAYEDVKMTSIKVRASTSTALTDASTSTVAFTSLKLKSSDGASQYGITKNLTDGGASAVDYVTFDGITNLTVPKGQTVHVYLYANVDGSSGDWYFGTTATGDLTGTGVTSGNSATVTGTGVSTAQTITDSATITFSKDASTGATQLVAVGASGTGTEVEVLSVDVDAQYEDVDITKLLVYYVAPTGDNASGAFADSGVKLYKKTNNGSEVLVGSSSFVPGSAATSTATFNITAGDLRIGKDDTNMLIVKVLFNGVNTGASSANSPLVQIGDGVVDDTTVMTAKGVSSGSTLAVGSINGANVVNILGNDRILYKSFPTVTFESPGTSLQNGVENDIFKFKVKADANGNISMKQLSFEMDIVDNRGTVNDGQATSFKLYRGTTDISANVLIQAGINNVNGASTGEELETGTNVITTGTGKTFFVTWEGTNEETVPAGSEYTYTVKATLSGFGTDADDDYLRVRMSNTQGTSGELSIANDPYYLMVSSTVPSILVLTDSVGINTSSVESIIWSDRSAAGHSAATGTLGAASVSTGDWFNGYYMQNTPTNYSMLIR